jgi:inner membrane protein YhjD
VSAVADAVNQAKLRVERARARWPAVDVGVSTFKRFSEDDGGTLAAALTYYIFFSIFPLLLFGVAALGFVTRGNEELKSDILAAGVDSFPLLRDVLQPAGLDFFERRAGGLALTAIALALYSGSGAVVALEHSLNRIDHISEEGTFIQKRVRSVRWLVLLAPAAVATAGLAGLANFSSEMFGARSVVTTGVSILSYVGGVLVSAIVFALAFKLLSRAGHDWRDVVPGALAGALAFELLKAAGSTFLAAGTKGREGTFGAFAAAAGLLVVAFLISRITLLAAELNAVLAERRLTRQPLLNQAGRQM